MTYIIPYIYIYVRTHTLYNAVSPASVLNVASTCERLRCRIEGWRQLENNPLANALARFHTWPGIFQAGSLKRRFSRRAATGAFDLGVEVATTSRWSHLHCVNISSDGLRWLHACLRCLKAPQMSMSLLQHDATCCSCRLGGRRGILVSRLHSASYSAKCRPSDSTKKEWVASSWQASHTAPADVSTADVQRCTAHHL